MLWSWTSAFVWTLDVVLCWFDAEGPREIVGLFIKRQSIAVFVDVMNECPRCCVVQIWCLAVLNTRLRVSLSVSLERHSDKHALSLSLCLSLSVALALSLSLSLCLSLSLSVCLSLSLSLSVSLSLSLSLCLSLSCPLIQIITFSTTIKCYCIILKHFQAFWHQFVSDRVCISLTLT